MSRKGRPAQFGVAAKKKLFIRVTDEQWSDLAQVSREVGAPMTAVIREAVNTYVADYRDGAVPFRVPQKGPHAA